MMPVGFRVRGSAGQIQISDASYNYMVTRQGGFDSSNYVLGDDHVVAFFKPINSVEPPLIFLRFNSAYVMMGGFSLTGRPGEWTGFSMWLGWVNENGSGIAPMPCSGDWFAASTKVEKSNELVGIRIRNGKSGEIVYDSGYPLVKFLSQESNFTPAGRIHHTWLIYKVGRPARSFFLANTLAGSVGKFGKYDEVWMQVGQIASEPSTLYLYFLSRLSSPPYQSHMWTALFASYDM